MVDTGVDSRTAARAFTRAVGVAAGAPSINNSQPWWWRLAGDVCELRAQRDRQLNVGDPDGRLLLFSCGAALHHARVALAAEGWRFEVHRLPERGKPDLLARLRLVGQAAPDVAAVRLSHAVHLRYTDRRPLSTSRVDDEALAAVDAAIEAQGARLYLVCRNRVNELGAIARAALEIERAQSSWIEEIVYWTGGRHPDGTGLPAGAIPERPAETIVPNRDFGRPGSLPVSSGRSRGAKPCLVQNSVDPLTATSAMPAKPRAAACLASTVAMNFAAPMRRATGSSARSCR